jgi:hypothetical protein
MGVYENRIEQKARQLGWSIAFTAAIANKFDIRGASEAMLSRAFAKTKDLSSHETAAPLDNLLGRFIKMCEAFQPFTLRLDEDPEKAKQLLESFESREILVYVGQRNKDLAAIGGLNGQTTN